MNFFHELERLIDVEEAKKALANINDGGTLTLSSLKKQLGM